MYVEELENKSILYTLCYSMSSWKYKEINIFSSGDLAIWA